MLHGGRAASNHDHWALAILPLATGEILPERTALFLGDIPF